MVSYHCKHCGNIVSQEIDWLDSGTIIFCPMCDGQTIVDLSTPAERADFFTHYEIGRNHQSTQQHVAAEADSNDSVGAGLNSIDTTGTPG